MTLVSREMTQLGPLEEGRGAGTTDSFVPLSKTVTLSCHLSVLYPLVGLKPPLGQGPSCVLHMGEREGDQGPSKRILF